jgi:hypothetical protein
MSTDTVITHTEALRLIDAQIGEQVYVGFLVARAGAEGAGEDPIPFVHRIGSLENPLTPKPPRLNPGEGFYRLGGEAGEWFHFAAMAGTIHLRDNGVDFRVADTVSIRVAWRGSKEVGNPWSQPADLPRLLATGQRARAEILEASPTEHKVAAGEDERRIWSLRLRVHSDGEPAFEAMAEHAFRLSPDFEAKIEGGYSFKMVPEGTAELEVVYDPDDHEQVVVCPGDADEPRGLRLVGIVGGPPERSTEDDAPPPSRR